MGTGLVLGQRADQRFDHIGLKNSELFGADERT